MSDRKIYILVNERKHFVPHSSTVGHVRDSIKPDADVQIVNGFPAKDPDILKEGDRLVLIKRGEIPGIDELEALLTARHTPGISKILKNSVVGIAGLGGLGSAVAIALARMGLGTLILVDYDVVEPSNLNRQQFTLDQIGLHKTEAIKTILSNINPYVRIKTFRDVLKGDNLRSIFQSAVVLVECFDLAEEKKMLLETAPEYLPNTFIIGASGLAGYGDSNSIKTWRLSDRIFVVGDLEKSAESGQGLMAPRVGIAAHHQANLVISLLLDPAETPSQIPDIS
ncbi:sulfur carrier protein ThiS adenylyltransferase ThiF [Acidobacteriota bacterium]